MLEPAVDGGSHWVGGPLWGGLTGSGHNRLTLRGCCWLIARLGHIASSLHTAPELRSEGGVRPHVVSQPSVSGHSGLVRVPSSQVELVRSLQDWV